MVLYEKLGVDAEITFYRAGPASENFVPRLTFQTNVESGHESQASG